MSIYKYVTDNYVSMITKLTIILLIIPIQLVAQENCDFIPKDLDEAFYYLDCKWCPSDIKKFKRTREENAIKDKLSWMTFEMNHYWELWKGEQEINRYFAELNVSYPEDMAYIILSSYHRHLRHKKTELEKQIKYITNYRQEIIQLEKESKINAMSKFLLNDTVFHYSHNFISEQQKEANFNGSCIAKGLVIEKDLNSFRLKVLLLESCDPKGIIIDKYSHIMIDGKWIEKETMEVLKKNEIKWTSYELWTK